MSVTLTVLGGKMKLHQYRWHKNTNTHIRWAKMSVCQILNQSIWPNLQIISRAVSWAGQFTDGNLNSLRMDQNVFLFIFLACSQIISPCVISYLTTRRKFVVFFFVLAKKIGLPSQGMSPESIHMGFGCHCSFPQAFLIWRLIFHQHIKKFWVGKNTHKG